MAASQNAGVAVVIPCFNHKRFLAGAIDSALAQTVAASEIIVVDDGSTESIDAVVSGYSGAILIRQDNRGLAGARNVGLKAAASDKIVFLDADDRLLPDAIATGLDRFMQFPDAAFVYGAHRIVAGDTIRRTYFPVSSHRELVRCNWVGMIGTVMFDRAMLLEIGGFDESLGMCEDWDAYLRLSRAHPFASHDHVVADYVKHEGNASNDLHRLWKWIEVVRTREWERGLDPEDQLAWREGGTVWERMLGPDPAKERPAVRAGRRVARTLRHWFR
jgi:glycosyltransferase involved in cell wall biosynthesis